MRIGLVRSALLNMCVQGLGQQNGCARIAAHVFLQRSKAEAGAGIVLKSGSAVNHRIHMPQRCDDSR